jgi:uncharacterized protein YgbK (DUF1537 family)
MAVLAGSVSDATLGQIAHARQSLPHRLLAVDDLAEAPRRAVADAVDWATTHLEAGRDVLIHSAEDRGQVRAAQRRFGADHSARLVERALAHCARALADRGTRRFLVAGGESSGAVVEALGVTRLRIGPAIAPGVSWTEGVRAGRPVNLALKSGNFGARDLFTTAQDRL